MKNLTIAGRITRDSVLRRTQSGDPVLGFSVAVDDRSSREKTALFFDVSLWGKRGEALEQHLRKGTALTVSGDLSTREHEGKTYLTVRANEVTLQGGGERQEQRPPRQEQSYAEASGGRLTDELSDEVPF